MTNIMNMKKLKEWWSSFVKRHRNKAKLRRAKVLQDEAERRIYIKDAIDGSIYLWVDDVPVLLLGDSDGVKKLAQGDKISGLKMLMLKARLQYINMIAVKEGIANNEFKATSV